MKRILLFLFVFLFHHGLLYSQTHFSKVWSGNGYDHMNFNVISATIDGVGLQTGDEIAVFDGIYCVGVQVVAAPGTYLFIVASEDDPETSAVDGYTEGKSASFKIWDSSEGAEITNISIEIVSGTLIFSPGESAWVKLSGTPDCAAPPAPVIGAITHPTSTSSTGSVVLSGLPATGTWT
jgi:hypothetical protein